MVFNLGANIMTNSKEKQKQTKKNVYAANICLTSVSFIKGRRSHNSRAFGFFSFAVSRIY